MNIDQSFLAGVVGGACGLVLKLYRAYVSQPEGRLASLLRDRTFWVLAGAMVLASGGVAWGLVGDLTARRLPAFICGAGAYLVLRDVIKTYRENIQRKDRASRQGEGTNHDPLP